MKHEYIAPTSSLVSLAPYEMLANSIEKSEGTITSSEDILSNEKDFGDSSFWDD